MVNSMQERLPGLSFQIRKRECRRSRQNVSRAVVRPPTGLV
jgi:hypothetical protein